METRIQIEYSDSKIAEAIAQAVSPDNFKTPKGLCVQTLREENRVITVITCENKLATLIATIDDLLFCISTAEKTLQIVK
ncbi:MAG: KEOPS complex subunit Pcc1 [Candidatus Bathyarchaeota archaeon]|nr:KEOPS complex subunit Pcc1 [Candidatus Bathyarchaeota archaeon]MDD4324835.1 KEOPS complex subunit Pcc1 [Candidatus Bathyarchaeota archaeon]MDI9576565.1 KEOPS complex subunit Pcc1 [Thermoproteota archaeon]MDT8782976.1 KEOPS complex subunit [Candidatus Bathyarchaeota archaeon]NLD66378.1 KEOPS complex subunit [Thermoproteota archaeon]